MGKSYKVIFPIIFSFQVIYSSILASSTPTKLDSLILLGKEYIYQLNISRAQQTFDKIIRIYPDYPHGYFYQAYLTLIVFSQDMTNNSLAEELDRQIKISVDKANQYKDKVSKEDKRVARQTDAKFYLGASYGLKAIDNVVDRNYFGGYWSGRKAKYYLESVIKEDTKYNDAYLGLGIFHYYVGLLPGLLKFIAGILGFDGDKEKGRQEVLLTSQGGHYFKVEAYLTYYIIRYFLEGDKLHSVQKLSELYRRYPSNAAIGLILAYHNRRFGYTKKCIEYCESVPDSFITILPQIVDIKYYNLAVSHYDMNSFEEADSLFDALIQLPTRKSLYYQSAIKFYKGILAALSFKQDTAHYYFKNIFKHKQTKYWYYQAQMYLKYQMDSLMYKEIYARNLLYSRQFEKGLIQAKALKKEFDSGARSRNPNISFMIIDLLAENYYYQKEFGLAKQLYDGIAPNFNDIEDDYQRAWIRIHYARCLRDTGDYELAEKMLDKAHDLDEDFTRLIVERERYILSQSKQKNEKTKG
jgi:tetratricopeptide (TPR) repeat protein